jgi:hypothetical protein
VSAFIDQERERFAVELICDTLGTSASAYYQRRSGPRSARAVEDERLLARIEELHAANYYAYGYRRMWKALLRAGESVGRDHVRRLMREGDIQGAKRRGKPWRTTICDPAAHRPPDLVQRDFSATRPDALWVADFSYLRCWEGVVFFSFVIDAYSRRIVGWQFASHMRTDLVLDALRMALMRRQAGADVALVHHSDAGSQPEFNRSSQQCVLKSTYRSRTTAWRGKNHQRAGLTRLSSRRLARRAGRSGDSRARAWVLPPSRRDAERRGVSSQLRRPWSVVSAS